MMWANSPARNGQIADRVAELMTINGGNMEVTSVGKIVKADNRYGRLGLMPQEAMELAYLTGSIAVLVKMFPHEVPAFNSLVQQRAKGQLIEIATPEQVKALL